jgi:hypothetical protein
MTTRIKLRRDSAQNWTTSNPILALGEPGLETDTGQIKYGDGVTRWIDLAYAGANALSNVGAITVETGDADRWFVRLRREDGTQNPDQEGVVVFSTNYDQSGNVIAVAALQLDNYGVAVFKFTPAGELVWKKSLDAVDSSYYVTSNALVDGDNNIICALAQENDVAVIVKINGSTGAVIFSERVDFNTGYTLTSIAVDSGNNIIIGGHFYFVSADTDTAFVAKLNPTATSIIWQKSLTGDNSDSYINSLVVDFNDAIIVAGSAQYVHTVDGQPVTDITMLVAKLTSTGTLSWQKTVALEAINEGMASGISVDSVGNVYVTGTYYVDNPGIFQPWTSSLKTNAAVIFKMSTLGAIVWDRRVGPGECNWVGISSAVGDDGDLYVYASTYQLNPAGIVDINNGVWNATMALARYNKLTGAVIWQRYFDNPHAQEFPAMYDSAPWGGLASDLMSVQGDKILIGGAVRLGESDADQQAPWGNYRYFNQGFVAQFDTDATLWSAEGWSLKPSRIPGKLTNTLVALSGPLQLQNDIAITPDGSANVPSLNVGVSVRRASSKINTWTFGKDGTLTNPEDSNIKLQQTQLGYATMYGLWTNNDDDIWYECVCHDAEGYAYAVSSNNWLSNRAHIHKYTPEGQVVWTRQLFSGSGASFDVTVTDGVYTAAVVDTGGDGYKVGDRIILSGSDLGGNNTNSLTLQVATITNVTDFIGEVATVTIESGTANPSLTGVNNYFDIGDFNDNAKCDVKSMALDPVSGNIVLVVTTPTTLADVNFDSDWTETVALIIDNGSGTVISTTTLTDEGDLYAYDVSVSATGKVAIVGEKFNEYNEYGAVTPLAGSGVDQLRVIKSDIDAEHFPGDGFSQISDWWITGSAILDQVQVTSVNSYTNLTGTLTRPGSGAVFSVDVVGTSYTTINATNAGSAYLAGQKFKITGDLLGGTTPTNDLTFTVGVDGSGSINLVVNPTGTATGADQTYTLLSGTKVNGTGASFNINFNAITGALETGNVNASGQDYLVGDVITVPGTSLAGGTSPTNNITVTITDVNGTQVANPQTYSGTTASTHLLINTDDTVDFAAVGDTFGIRQNVGGEAFVWTPDFNKAIGGPTSDWFSGVTWNAAGTHLYAVGSGRYEVNYDQALVVKYSSTGTLVESKYINNNMGDNGADSGAVALMANDAIVVVYDMYNTYRDETNEVLVTKLDSNLNIIWQQFIGVESTDGWVSPNSNISVAVDPVTDEILIAWYTTDYSNLFDDDAIHMIKLDTDGEVLWKRMFGINESDTRMCYNGWGNKALSIHGDQFTLVGYTDGANDNSNDNAFIVTLPLDGTGLGEHGLWSYVEPNDDRIKVWRLSGRTSVTFTPTVHTNGITATPNIKYYYTNYPQEEFTFYPVQMQSQEGGAIEFADGSKQTFSTAIVPQVKISAGRYTLRPEDSGRHILIEASNYSVVIPNWQSVTLPVGYTVSIVNISSNDAYVTTEFVSDLRGEMWLSNGDMKTSDIGFSDTGSGQMITLIKIKEGTRSDDAENHGDIWMVAAANYYNND